MPTENTLQILIVKFGVYIKVKVMPISFKDKEILELMVMVFNASF